MIERSASNYKRREQVLWLLMLAAPLAYSQAPQSPASTTQPTGTPPAAPQAEITTRQVPATFRSRVNMVSVPVVVRDS